MAHDVFISYATENKAIADAVCAALEVRGIRCWIAPRDVRPGSSYAHAISKAIAIARVTVVVLSGDANRSPHVRKEALLAFKAAAHIIPLRVENVSPEEGLEYVLEGEHWLDALTPPLEAHLKTLADTITAVLNPTPAAPPPPVRPSRDDTDGKTDRPPAGASDLGKPTRVPVRPRTILAAVILGLIGLVGLAVWIPALQRGGAKTPDTGPKTSGTGRIVTIEQDGRTVPESNGEVRVRRAPFTMVLTIPLRAAVRVHVSTTGEGAYERVQSGGPLSDVFRRGGAVAESKSNQDRTLFLSAYPPTFHYWYYRDDSDTRFDSVEVRETTLVARRIVAAVATPEGVTHRLEEFAHDNLFFIIGVAPSSGDVSGTELGRQTFKVVLSGEITEKPIPEKPVPKGPTQIQVAGEWNWSESVRGDGGLICMSSGALSLQAGTSQLSGRVSGTERCSPLEGLRMGPQKRFFERLEAVQISGTRISFEIGACRYQGRISEAGTRITGTVRGCAMDDTGGTLKPQSLSGDWQAARR